MRIASISIWTGSRLSRLGQKLDVRKRSADHEQGVARFKSFLRRLSSKQPHRAVVYGLSSGTAAFPSNGLMIGAPNRLGDLFELIGGRESAASG